MGWREEKLFLGFFFFNRGFFFDRGFFGFGFHLGFGFGLGGDFSPVAGARLGVLANDAPAKAVSKRVVKSLFMESSLVEV